VRTIDHGNRLGHRRRKPKRPPAMRNVVVDRFRDANDGDWQFSAFDFLGDGVCAALRAVAAHAVQDVNLALFEKVHSDAGLLRSPRCTEDRAAQSMNAAHHRAGK
jgi:hypothetical protein